MLASATVLSVLARLLAALQFYCIALLYSKSAQIDLYIFQFNITSSFGAIASILSVFTVIPLAVKHSQQLLLQTAIVNIYYYFILCLAVLISSISYLYPHWFFSSISRFNSSYLDANSTYLYYFGLMLLLFAFNSYMYDIMLVRNKLVESSIGLALNYSLSLGIILYFKEKGIIITFIGISVGLVMGILYYLWCAFKAKWLFFYSFNGFKSYNRTQFVLTALAYSASLMAINFMPVYVFSHTPGAVTALNYSLKILDIVNLLLLNFVLTVGIIKFSALYASNNYAQLNKQFVQLVEIILVIVLPISFVFWFDAQSIITLLFGKNLSAEISILSVQFLQYFAAFMAASALTLVLIRLNYAIQNQRFTNLAQLIIYLVLCTVFLLIYKQMSVALFVTLSVGSTLVLLSFMLNNLRVNIDGFNHSILYILKILLGATISWAISYWTCSLLNTDVELFNLGIHFLVYLLVFFAIGKLIGYGKLASNLISFINGYISKQ